MKTKPNTTETDPTPSVYPSLHRKHPGYKIITQNSLIIPQNFPVTQTVDHAGRNASLVWPVHDVMKCVSSVQWKSPWTEQLQNL